MHLARRYTSVEWLLELVLLLAVAMSASGQVSEAGPVCWGSNTDDMSVLPSPAMELVQLSAGATSTCGLTDGQVVKCWGSNTFNQLNFPSTGRYKSVSVGYAHACAIVSGTNQTICWGSNNQSQLAVPTGAVFESIACGWWHSCGIQYNGTVLCWGAGANSDQAFGQATVPNSAAALVFKQVAPGYRHTCGLTNDSAVVCWGNTTTTLMPAGSFKAVGAGDSFSCVLRTNGTAVCWGSDNSYGQLNVPANALFTNLWVSRFYACGLLEDGDTIECWGASKAVLPPARYSGWSRVTAGESHMCGFAVAASTPSPSQSPPSSSTPTATATPSPPRSPTPSTSRTPSPSTSRSPTPSPSSPVVSLAPISANVTATFGTDAPVVAVAAPVAATSGAPASNVQVRSELSQLQSGSTDLSNVVWAVTNSSSDSGGGTTNSSSTINYSAVLADNTTSVTQSYAFHAQSFASQFSGLDFTVSAGAIKWSINLTSTALNASSSSSSSGLQFAFRVSTNATATTTTAASSSVRVFRNTPRASMTTYWVPSGVADVVVEVQVFDVALVDGDLMAINHSVVLADAASAGGALAYDLMLWFPPFGRSLEYDPSIGLGVLVGSNGRDGGGGTSSDNTAVIVGVAVAVPVAIAIVLAVIVAALVYGFYRRRKAASSRGLGSSINFGDDEGEENL